MEKQKKYIVPLGLVAVVTAGFLGASSFSSAFAQSNSVQPNTAANSRNGTFMGKHRGGFGHGMDMMGGMFGENVQRTVKNLDNGVQITLTSTDPATVTKLQAMKMPVSKDANVTIAQKNLDNGIEITMTSTDSATVTKLQQRELKPNGGFGHGMGMMGGMFDKNVQRTVKNIDNGVQITLTSTDPAIVTKLQEREQKREKKLSDSMNSGTTANTPVTQP